jgi:hypothetical protein
MMPNRALCPPARLILPLLWSFVMGGVAAAQVPSHLDIASATVAEVPPVYPGSVPGRSVTLQLTVNGTPVCNATTGFLAYGFLIDADSDPATGLSDVAFQNLGVDARVTAICDAPTGAFVSQVGTVTVTSGGGTTTIEILTTVDRLPSLEFRWIAFAQEDQVFSRLPQAPEYARWTTLEKGVF